MHRDLQITVAAAATDRLLDELTQIDGVITLSVQRGESIKPPGDVISASVLNNQVDAVLRSVQTSAAFGALSICHLEPRQPDGHQ